MMTIITIMAMNLTNCTLIISITQNNSILNEIITNIIRYKGTIQQQQQQQQTVATFSTDHLFYWRCIKSILHTALYVRVRLPCGDFYYIVDVGPQWEGRGNLKFFLQIFLNLTYSSYIKEYIFEHVHIISSTSSHQSARII